MKPKPPAYSGRWFLLINGSYTRGDKLCAYCLYHKGLLNDRLAKVHDCKHKNSDGTVCRRYIEFERHDNYCQPKPVGEEFRNTL